MAKETPIQATANNCSGIFQKAIQQKLCMLEKVFLHKNVSHIAKFANK